MKEKLSKIRDALAEIKSFSVGTMSSHQTLDKLHTHTSSSGALAEAKYKCDYALLFLDSILAELDSAELVEKVEDAIFKLEDCSLESTTQVAINTIKGE